MKLSNFVKVAPSLYKTRKSVLLQGAPGCGKTDTIRALPAALEDALNLPAGSFGLVEYLLTTRESVDMAGFMVPSKSDFGDGEVPVATYTMPDVVRRVLATGKEYGVLFLDEFSQAEHDMQKAAAQLIHDREVNGFKLPDGWWVIMASNRTEHRAGVKPLLSFVANRMVILDVHTTPDDWAAWAADRGYHPLLVAFSKFQPQYVFSEQVPATPEPFSTARSFAGVCEYFKLLESDISKPLPADDITMEVVAGAIGDATATHLAAFLKTHNLLPTASDILETPDTAKVPGSDRLDAVYAAAQLAVEVARQHKDKDMATRTQVIDAVMTYIGRLPPELRIATVRDIVSIPEMVAVCSSSEKTTQFLEQNRSLLDNTL